MTLENADVSARLRDTRAKDGEQPFRQQNWVSEVVRKCSGHQREAGSPSVMHVTPPRTSFGALALWVDRANVCAALTIRDALWSHTLGLCLGAQRQGPPSPVLECSSEDATAPTADNSLFRSPPSLGGRGTSPGLPSGFPEAPAWAQHEGRCVQEREGTAKYVQHAAKVIRWGSNLI